MSTWIYSSKKSLVSSFCASFCAAFCVLFAFGCSDSGSSAPDMLPDLPETDGTVFRCQTPGQPCNAHDNCAINPTCGKDYVCRGERYQNCADELECTFDSCKGQGLCGNEPKPGFCVLNTSDGKGGRTSGCFKEGDVNPEDPCKVCDPKANATRWSPRTGGDCDDENPCTQDDVCKEGQCKGTYFGNKCSDGLSCTDDICDGNGGCTNRLDAQSCLIKGVCYKAQERSNDGCSVCDPKNPRDWTPLTDFCKVGLSCFAPGEKDSSGCGVCDPQKDKTGWSRAPDTCLVDGLCYQRGEPDLAGCGSCDPTRDPNRFSPAVDKCQIDSVCIASATASPSGCSQCDPATDAYAWTPSSSASAQSEGFESGTGSYTISALVGDVGWQLSQARKKGGTQSLYFGHLQNKSYDSGVQVSGTASTPTLTLPAGQKAALRFAVYLDIEPSKGFDTFEVRVGQEVLWRKPADQSDYRRFIWVELDLAKYAGTSITVDFAFDSKDGFGNTGEGIYLDDVTLLTNCGSL
jgi:hypothetical protein